MNVLEAVIKHARHSEKDAVNTFEEGICLTLQSLSYYTSITID